MFVQESTLTGCENQRRNDVRDNKTGRGSRGATVPVWKRILDILIILTLAPLWMPVMFIIAVGIRIASKGPVFFRQERIGWRGRKFWCLKFRSMHCNADTAVHREHLDQLMKSGAPMVKLDKKNDPRLIPFGDILRASGLDELPQIFNVLRGEMSLIGPRPCTCYEFDGYLPWQMERFDALPGLTGLWQVTGKNKTTFDEMIGLDIRYSRQMSLKQDLWIVMKTGGVLISQMTDALRNRFVPEQMNSVTQE